MRSRSAFSPLVLFFALFAAPSVRAESVVLHELACENKLVGLIDGARERVDVSVYSINNKRLVAALIAARDRGVKVRVLTDRVQAGGSSSKIWELLDAGVELRVHSHKRIMHTKVGIYVGVSVSSGSFNWTEPAVRKNEEVCDVFVDEPDYARQHQVLFDARWADNPAEKSDEWIAKKRAERAKKAARKAEDNAPE